MINLLFVLATSHDLLNEPIVENPKPAIVAKTVEPPKVSTIGPISTIKRAAATLC